MKWMDWSDKIKPSELGLKEDTGSSDDRKQSSSRDTYLDEASKLCWRVLFSETKNNCKNKPWNKSVHVGSAKMETEQYERQYIKWTSERRGWWTRLRLRSYIVAITCIGVST